MSVMEFRKNEHEESSAVSGGAMDKVVVRKRIDKRILIGGAGGLALILILAFWLFAPRAGSQSVAMDRLTISTVEKSSRGSFVRQADTSTEERFVKTTAYVWGDSFGHGLASKSTSATRRLYDN